MSGSNKVLLKGNLGRDPEVQYTPSGTAICRFSIATSEKWKDRDGNRQEHTEWHLIKCFGRLAEVAGEHLAKGSPVMVWGKIRTNKFQDKNGNDRSVTEIHVDELEFIGSRSNGGGSGNGGNNAPRPQPPEQRPPQQNRSAQPQPPQQPVAAGDDAGEFFDDDIPF